MKLPLTPTPLADLLRATSPDDLAKVLGVGLSDSPLRDDRYIHWDKLRHLKPPEGLTHELWWIGLKLARSAQLRPLPLKDLSGQQFKYSLPDPAVAMLHRIDRDASGRITVSEEVTNQATRDRYIVSSLIEEAITSSQLEGASTSRKVAKEMLRTGRPPRNKSEQMILNNYLAMRRIGELREQDLTPELVLDVHKIVTEGTLDNPDSAGRLQAPDEVRVQVWDEEGTLLHTPPPAHELSDRLALMCDFANGRLDSGFMHPVVRAVILHFSVGYDHPFEDGNGRTARALFYWSMLRQGYWLTEFITISRILKKAPAQYARSYLFTETDDGDVTYFLLYNLEVVCRALDELHNYLARKVAEVRATEQLLRRTATGMNHRQLALISHALKKSDAWYTIKSHSRSHDVAYETARSDLMDLVARGLVRQSRVGKEFVFHPADGLANGLRPGK